MVKHTEDYDLITSVVGFIKKKFYDGKTEWKDDNTLSFGEKSKIVFDDQDIIVTGKELNALFMKYKKIYTEKLTAQMPDAELKKTALKGMNRDPSSFGNYNKNIDVTNALLAELKKLKITNIKIKDSLRNNQTLSDTLTLGFSLNADGGKSHESGYWSRLKTFLKDNLPINISEEEISVREASDFKNYEGEQITDLTYKKMLIGKYYPERNFIHFFFNPFVLYKVNVFDEELPDIFKIMFRILRKADIKINDTSKIQEKVFVTEFMKGTRTKLQNVQNNKEDNQTHIIDYERKIRGFIQKTHDLLTEETFIKQQIDNNGKGLWQEVMKTKKLPFVQEVKITGGEIDLLFKPTFLTIPKMMRTDGGKQYGKRYVYIGSIGFRVTSDNFNVYNNDINLHGRAHPHAGGNPGSPCFGDGDGKYKIFEYLATNKFTELTKMLWFWIKTYRNSGAYVKVWDWYDESLNKGIPIFDDKKVRIVANDKNRIESGEQHTVPFSEDYEDNLKKYINIKLEE